MDDFREWLSDNLRYFMLGGGILIIVLVLFFGARACSKFIKGRTEQGQSAGTTNQGNDPSSPANNGEINDGKKENPLEKADAEITALVQEYYRALGEKDIAGLKQITNDFSSSDEAKINAEDYIEKYTVGEVYTKKGMDANSTVVYVCYQYHCKGIETTVPVLSELYVIKDSEGNLKFDGGFMQDAKILAYLDNLSKHADVNELTLKVEQQYVKAQESDPELAEFLAGLGNSSNDPLTSPNGSLLTVTDTCNVRATADINGEILGGLVAGTKIEKKGTEGDWVQIEFEGSQAYVHGSLLKK